MVAVILLVLVIFSAGCSWKPENTPDDVIKQFEQAVKDRDVGRLMEIVVSMDKLYAFTERDAENLIRYLRDERDVLERELERLEDMADGRRKREVYDNAMFYLDYTEGKWGMGGKYRIAYQPSYANVYTNFKGTVIYLDGKEVATASGSDQTRLIGPLGPGEYKLRAAYMHEGKTYESDEITVSLPDKADELIDLKVKAAKIRFDSNYAGAELYLNGESTGKTIAELYGEEMLLATDGSVTAQAKLRLDDGVLESEPVAISGFEDYYFLGLPDTYIYVSSAVAGAELVLDGKPTGKLLGDINMESKIGPVAGNREISFRAEIDTPWGRFSSREEYLYVEEDAYNAVYLRFIPDSEEIIQPIENALISFVRSGLDAVNAYDDRLIQHVTSGARYLAFDSFFGQYYYGDASLTGLEIDMGAAEVVYGLVNGPNIEQLVIGPIYFKIDYDVSNAYGDFYSDYRRYAVNVSYNPALGVWEVDNMWDVYDYWGWDSYNPRYHSLQ
jgi:hypothetical protein